MEEPEFWGQLEYGICHEFRGFGDNRLRRYWCDGLVPEQYVRIGGHWQISGRAWIETQDKPGKGQRPDSQHEPWTFILITRHAEDRDDISWDQLLPSGQLTGWLTLDPASRTLTICPAAGYDD